MSHPAFQIRAFPAFAGCGGAIKENPEDFRVEELPAYAPSGSGDHMYVRLEKTGLSTRAVARRLAVATGLSPTDVGYAGMKDARAVTTQWFSLQGASESDLNDLEGDGLRILEVTRHGNKLRLGHLAGNRFEVLVRGAIPPPDFPALLANLCAQGFPNTFGPQRFGQKGDNAARGKVLLRTGFKERLPLATTRLLTNAYQSALFNRLVAIRLAATGELARFLPGDLAVFSFGRAFFGVSSTEVHEANARAATWEISASAPLFGYKTPLAGGDPGRWELELLLEEEITPQAFKQGGKRLSAKGERRAVRARPADLTCTPESLPDGPALRFRFILPPGSYATSLLHELMGDAPSQPSPHV